MTAVTVLSVLQALHGRRLRIVVIDAGHEVALDVAGEVVAGGGPCPWVRVGATRVELSAGAVRAVVVMLAAGWESAAFADGPHRVRVEIGQRYQPAIRGSLLS